MFTFRENRNWLKEPFLEFPTNKVQKTRNLLGKLLVSIVITFNAIFFWIEMRIRNYDSFQSLLLSVKLSNFKFSTNFRVKLIYSCKSNGFF